MEKEQQKDKIIEIVKKAIDDNSVTSYGEDDIVSIDGNDVDHIAEEVAEAIYNFYEPIDNEPVGAMYIEGCRKGFFSRDNQVRTLAVAIKELKDENAGLNRECNDYLAKIDRLQEKLAQAQEDNSEFQRQLRNSHLTVSLLDTRLKLARRQTAEEFAEKLKEKFDGYDATSYNGYEEGFHDLQEEIDELLKEYE